MEMRTHLLQFGKFLCEFLCDHTRLQRAKAKTFYSLQRMQTLDQVEEINILSLKIHTVRAEMDTGQNDFLITVGCERKYFLFYILRSAASDTSSGIWDDAITAELITSILHLDKGAGMICLTVNIQAFVLMRCRDMNPSLHVRQRTLPKEGLTLPFYYCR